jgi:hypothetical protein
MRSLYWQWLHLEACASERPMSSEVGLLGLQKLLIEISLEFHHMILVVVELRTGLQERTWQYHIFALAPRRG